MEEFRKRISELLKAKGLTLNKVANGNANLQVKFSRQINHDAAITLDTVMAFLDFFPDLNAEWLLRGEGEMFKKSPLNLFAGNGGFSTEYIAQKVNAELQKGFSEEDFKKLETVTGQVILPDSVTKELAKQQEQMNKIMESFRQMEARAQQTNNMADVMKFLIEQNKSQKEQLDEMRKKT